MKLSEEQLKAVFVKWNTENLENPQNVNNEAVTLENVESYSKDQSDDFVKHFKELNP